MSIKIIILFSFFNLIYLQHYKNSNPLKNLVCGEGIIENPSLVEYPNNIPIEDDFSPIRIFVDYTTFEFDCTKYTNILNFKSVIKEKLSKAVNLMEKIINIQRFKEKIYLTDDFISSISLSLPYYEQILTTGISFDLIVSLKIKNEKSIRTNFESKKINFNSYPLVIEPITKRPLLGIIEIFELNYSIMDNLETYFLNSFIHQLMHIMVFDAKLIKNFPNYDVNSRPYVRAKDYSQYRLNYFIITPKVLFFARRHFSNPHMLGLELDSNSYLPEENMYHWNARFMEGDIMIADFYEEQAISEMTLGLFEDSNWYKVNYYTGGLFRFGKNETFEFTDLKCFNLYDYFVDSIFCTKENQKRCTSGRLNKGLCKFYINDGIPTYFQYFSDNSTKGGRGNVDFCPITQKEDESRTQVYYFYPGSCQNGLIFRNGLEEVFSNNSFCAISNVIPRNKGLGKYLVRRAVCYPMYCTNTTLTIQIGNFFITCPRQGGVITLPDLCDYMGLLECPDYNLICTGTEVCNNIEDCINKKSIVKNSSFVYEGFTYAKQSLDNTYYYNIKSLGEGSDDGKCGKNCLYCDEKNTCLKCRDGDYYLASKNNIKNDTSELFCDKEEKFTDDKYEYYKGIYYFIGHNNNINNINNNDNSNDDSINVNNSNDEENNLNNTEVNSTNSSNINNVENNYSRFLPNKIIGKIFYLLFLLTIM